MVIRTASPFCGWLYYVLLFDKVLDMFYMWHGDKEKIWVCTVHRKFHSQDLVQSILPSPPQTKCTVCHPHSLNPSSLKMIYILHTCLFFCMTPTTRVLLFCTSSIRTRRLDSFTYFPTFNNISWNCEKQNGNSGHKLSLTWKRLNQCSTTSIYDTVMLFVKSWSAIWSPSLIKSGRGKGIFPPWM